MRTPEPTGPPLAYAAEILFELGQLRNECCEAARALLAQASVNERRLEETALLEDALAIAQNALLKSFEDIQAARSRAGETR